MPPFARHRARLRVSRACSLSNKAKQVAPEPDMRTKVSARLSREPREHGLDLRHERDRRLPRGRSALAPVAKRSAIDCRPSRRTRRRSTERDARVHQQDRRSGELRQIDRTSARLPPLRPRAGRLSRQAGTSLPSVGRDRLRMIRDRFATMTSAVCSAAAASADPPPMPEATGKRSCRA